MKGGLVTLGLGEDEAAAAAPDEAEPGPITVPASGRRSPPGGLAASALLHGALIALALETAALVSAPPLPPRPSRTPRADAVFLPSPVTLRRILGLPPAPRRPAARDRISVGPPAPRRTPAPLELHREDDLTATAKGTSTLPTATPPAQMAPAPPPPVPPRTRPAGAFEGRLAPPGLSRPPVAGPIRASLERLAAGSADAGTFGVPTGTGGRTGPLFFDPEGADFTAWIQHWKNEAYRCWIMPPSAEFGWSGEADFEFVMDRGGRLVRVELLRSSGIPAYDRAARNALTGSHLLPLPADYAPATVTMRVGFVYNEGPGARGGRGGG